MTCHCCAADRAWRQCYFAPGLLHLHRGSLILFFGQDAPDGNLEDLMLGGKKGGNKEEARRAFLYGIMNYRMWVFTITYGRVHPGTQGLASR
jgi:hypothetical protein